LRHVSASTDFTVGKNQNTNAPMAKYIYKYQFEHLVLYSKPDLWKKLVPDPEESSMMLVFTVEQQMARQSWEKYNIEHNPFYQLQKAEDIMRQGYITQTTFFSIKKKCANAYWGKRFTMTKEWILWYKDYIHKKETNQAREKWGHVFVKEYVDKQKAALTESFSRKILKDGTQVPEEVEGIIHEFIG